MDRLLKRVTFIPLVFRRIISRIFERLTSEIRVLPDFIIVGAQKSGTSSLYGYLKKHPYIIPTFKDEIHYFDSNLQKGLRWYKSNFPTRLYKFIFNLIYNRNFMTGEKSPYYIFHPYAIKHIRNTIPKVKIILLLRNPIARSYSHYNHSVKYDREKLTFEEAIKRESTRLDGELDKIIKDTHYKSFKHATYSYLTRSIYINQVKRLLTYFPKEQVMIIKTEDFFQNPQKILNEVYKFLELPGYALDSFKKHGFKGYAKLNETTKHNLVEYFKPYNKLLYQYLQRDFNWENE
ncbi:MAG: sulfotransferase domain-containing protein [Candidatus Hermodarchaeota archaeon]